MARVVVVGGGFGGLAVAARLAKLGHDVRLLEASDRLGGALSPVEAGGFTWDAGPTHTLLPAVVRDLFRKSGRPLEAELGVPTGEELAPLPVLREHRFVDGSVLRLPGGSRRAQREAFDGLGEGLGEAWDGHVAAYTEVWDLLRRHWFEEPWRPSERPAEVSRLLDGRESLRRRLRRAFRDDRLEDVAAHPFVADGHALRDVPAWAGVTSLLEQLFGGWTLPGGLYRLGDLLVDRLALRGVEVSLGAPVEDVVVRGGRVVAVRCAGPSPGGEVDADVVVCAVDPRRLLTLAPYVERTTPALPPLTVHLGLDGDPADLPESMRLEHETVLHGPALLTVRPGAAASGSTAWTVHGRGRISEDLLDVLARQGLDVRSRVVTRVDRTAREAVHTWGGSPLGVQWRGRSTVRARLGPTTPVPGVYACGASAVLGSGLPFVGLGAALVAELVGPA